MPVVLEQVDNPSEQDLIDLEKLYNDYPTDLRFNDLQDLLGNRSDISLYGARFNARLLAAVTTSPEEEGLKLDHLCVRSVTRQRNVARELLRQLINDHNSTQFVFESCIDDTAIERLFTSAGFDKQGNTYKRNP